MRRRSVMSIVLDLPLTTTLQKIYGWHTIFFGAVFPTEANLGRRRHTRPYRQSHPRHRYVRSTIDEPVINVPVLLGGNTGVGKETVKVR
jgi:hypothetical protein